MDAGSIARLMNLSPEKTEKLTQAWRTAELAAQGINTKQDALNALSANGIDNNFLARVSGYLNHPLAGVVANATGINLQKVRSDLSTLQQTTPIVQQAVADPLDKLRQGLQQLK